MLRVPDDVRRAVIFGRNDLLQDAPISRVDLLVSRNTLMYFAPSAQERILANFYFSLSREGFLCLGKAEALQSRTSLFVAYDLKRRVFVKNPDATPLRRRPARERSADEAAQVSPLRDVAFEQAPRAELILDLDGSVQAVNHVARGMFGLRRRDIGRPLGELEVWYWGVLLGSLIDQVQTDRRPFAQDVDWTTPGGESRYLNVQVTPLVTREGELGGISVSFADITRHRALHSALERHDRALDSALVPAQGLRTSPVGDHGPPRGGRRPRAQLGSPTPPHRTPPDRRAEPVDEPMSRSSGARRSTSSSRSPQSSCAARVPRVDPQSRSTTTTPAGCSRGSTRGTRCCASSSVRVRSSSLIVSSSSFVDWSSSFIVSSSSFVDWSSSFVVSSSSFVDWSSSFVVSSSSTVDWSSSYARLEVALRAPRAPYWSAR